MSATGIWSSIRYSVHIISKFPTTGRLYYSHLIGKKTEAEKD